MGLPHGPSPSHNVPGMKNAQTTRSPKSLPRRVHFVLRANTVHFTSRRSPVNSPTVSVGIRDISGSNSFRIDSGFGFRPRGSVFTPRASSYSFPCAARNATSAWPSAIMSRSPPKPFSPRSKKSLAPNSLKHLTSMCNRGTSIRISRDPSCAVSRSRLSWKTNNLESLSPRIQSASRCEPSRRKRPSDRRRCKSTVFRCPSARRARAFDRQSSIVASIIASITARGFITRSSMGVSIGPLHPLIRLPE